MTREEWKERFLEKVNLVHKKNKNKVVDKILRKIDSAKGSMQTRSKKYDVKYDISLDDLRELVFESYGQKCKYCDKILTVKTMVVDHIIPLSKGGESSISNLQIICKTSNSMKGSLTEQNYKLLLEWLETVPDELKRDVSIRLARGIN